MDVYEEASVETLKRSLISAITAFRDARQQGLQLCSLPAWNVQTDEQNAHEIWENEASISFEGDTSSELSEKSLSALL